MSVQHGVVAKRHGIGRRRGPTTVDHRLLMEHETAMSQLHVAVASLAATRASGAPLPERRAGYAEANRRFAEAAAAAQAVYEDAVAVAGGGLRGSRSPEGQSWDRVVNGLRTLWEAHRMREQDDAGVMTPNAVRVGSRSPIGPHQAGTEFEPPEALDARTNPTTGVAFPGALDGAAAARRPAYPVAGDDHWLTEALARVPLTR